jgi:hypothetical protein
MSEVRTDSLVNQSGDNDSGIDLSTNDVVAIKTANTEAMVVDSSANLKFNSGYGSVATGYGVRAWTYFAADSGTPVTQDSGGVSSLTDIGVGRISINLSFTMPDDDCAVVGTSQHSSSYTAGMVGRSNTSTTAVEVSTTAPNAAYLDANRSSFLIVR